MFEPIDEDATEARIGDAAGHVRPSQTGQEPRPEPMSPFESAKHTTGNYTPAKTTSQNAVVGDLQHDTFPPSIPYSKTSNLDFLKPRQAPVPHSTTTTLPSKQTPQPSSEAAYYEPGEVNRKVAAMLAATAELKPKSPPLSPKKTITGRVFSKLAGLFGGRRKNKSGKDTKKAMDDGDPGIGEVGRLSTTPQQPLSTKTPYIPFEGADSRALAPDWPVERKIPRKPIPNVRPQPYHANTGEPSSSQHTTAGLTVETRAMVAFDVFSTDREICTPPPFEKYRGKEYGDCGESQTKFADPFESERSFDNLQGFLTTQPIGASTPRASKDFAAGTNPPKDYFSRPGRMSYLSVNDADDEMTELEGRKTLSRRRKGGAPGIPDIRAQESSTNVAMDEDLVEPEAKTHPSPSKRSLEELSRQFNALLYRQKNSAGPSTSTATGVSPAMAAFPRPPTRIPASQTSALGTTDQRGLTGAGYSVPPSPTAQHLGTRPGSVRAPGIRPLKQMADKRRAPQQLASGGPSTKSSRHLAGDIDEQQGDDEHHVRRPHRA